MILSLFFLAAVRADEGDEDDFWDQIESDEVTVEEKTQGNLYDKARFDVPISRRLKLYPDVFVVVKRLQDHSRIEFVYEAKIPKLYFLDSQDVTVESFDLSKMSQDEIMSLLNLRGFALVSEETSEKKSKTPMSIGGDDSNTTDADNVASNEQNESLPDQSEKLDENDSGKSKENDEALQEETKNDSEEKVPDPDSRMYSETISEESAEEKETMSNDL